MNVDTIEILSPSWPGLSRPSTTSYDRFIQVVPFRVGGDYFSDFPCAWPMFDIVLALDCLPDVFETFKIDQALLSMALCEAINEPGSMFEYTTDKIIRHANVEGAVGPIGQNVNVAAGHREIVKDVDGRDKPGHDDGTKP